MAYQLNRQAPWNEGVMQDLTLRPRKTPAGEMWQKTQAGRQRALESGARSVADAQGPQQPPTTMLTRVPQAPAAPAPRPATPSMGGTITQGGLTRVYPPSAPSNPAMNSGGVMQRTGAAPIVVPPSPNMRALQAPPANPVVSPTTVGAPQTESSNPLTGTGNQQPQGSTGTIRTAPAPAQAMGFSSRGTAIPAGQDALANGGGNAPAAGAEPRQTGLMQRQFARPESQAFYDRVVKRLYGQT